MTDRAALRAIHGSLPELLEAVERFVERFVHFTDEHQAVAVTLWVAHVYAIDSAPAAAYLRVTSAVEESGKSTLLEILELLLGERGINAVSVSPSVVFRIRDKLGPIALLLDEVDNTLRARNDDSARDLLALVNSGYRRSAKVLRNVGQSHEPKAFAVFGPCAIAGLATLHATTESRCIPIRLERRLRAVSSERFLVFQVEEEARELADWLAAWLLDDSIGERLRAARPSLPEGLRDRQVEIWWALFAIADEAGGDWPERARAAAVALHLGVDVEMTMSTGVLLLQHIRAAFNGTDRLATVELLRHLVANEEGPWGRWWDPTSQGAKADLASKLRPFGVKPKAIRLSDGTTPRGYERIMFTDAWDRYLPPSRGGATTATPATHLASPVAGVAGVAGGPDRDAESDEPTLGLEIEGRAR